MCFPSALHWQAGTPVKRRANTKANVYSGPDEIPLNQSDIDLRSLTKCLFAFPRKIAANLKSELRKKLRFPRVLGH